MNSPIVKIHEFSTGIQAEKTPDGGWVSRGFTGQYINRTIEPIPGAVQSAISNREFAVAEGASRDNPAIIGREVSDGDQNWSVIAVVTRGGDDRGRSASMYRYFFCEGKGNLWKILAWIESERKGGRMPVFDPFETKFIGQPNKFAAPNQPQISLRPELQQLLLNNVPVIVPSGEPCTTLIVNQMATEQARPNNQLVAWAFQVEALEQPRGFLVIQPASEKAQELLHRAMASTPQYTAPIAREYEIKSAIKGLISRDKVKPEQVEVIETSINQVKESDWEVIFNGQGSSQALRQGIYSPQMVRLLTLRAMVIPQTLPEFLDWMQQRGKQEDHCQVSEHFQSEIKNSLSGIPGNAQNFTLKVSQGVKLIIPRLVDRPKLLDGVVWLLSSPYGLWKQIYSQQIASDIDHDLRLMNPQVKHSPNISFNVINNSEWKELSNQLQLYWPPRSCPPQEKYQPLADLFGQLEFPQIAAFFYHIGYGHVPKEIFYQISHKGGRYFNVYGVRVERQVTLPEILLWLLREIGGKIVPLAFVIPLMTLTFIVGLLGGKLLFEQPYSQRINPSSITTQDNYGSSDSANQQASKSKKDSKMNLGIQIPPDKKKEALRKFDETAEVIKEEVVKQLKQEGYVQEEVESQIRDELNLRLDTQGQQLDYQDILKVENTSQTTKEQWIKAIYKYQMDNQLPALGYIYPDNKPTAKKLKEDIRKKLLNKQQSHDKPLKGI
jgi:anti-sigma28 factor (negative regulator of flagellin synthesis)